MFGINKNAQQIESLVQQLNEVTSAKFMLEKQLEEARSIIETHASEQAKLKKKIQQHDAVLAGIEAKHKTEMESLGASVHKKVNATLASIGVNTFAVENFAVTPDQKNRDVLATFHSLEGAERTAYYNEHKADITRLMLAVNTTI